MVVDSAPLSVRDARRGGTQSERLRLGRYSEIMDLEVVCQGVLRLQLGLRQ